MIANSGRFIGASFLYAPMGQNFLLANPELRAKKQVDNIYDSYSHPWDILAELTQNSVDAIKEWEEEYPDHSKDHSITIKINKESRSIYIEDTGIGFKPSDLPDLLAPNATQKSGDNMTVGEKGVGVTFCIFCSNKFHISTKSISGTYEAELTNARTWREKDDVTEIPNTQNESSSEEENDPSETGTTIRLDDVNLGKGNDWTIFELSPPRMEYLLRTKTAIGNTKTDFTDDEPEIDVELSIVDAKEGDDERNIDYRYYYPHLFWDDDQVIDLEEFENRDDIGRMTDDQKRQHLEGKLWKISGEKERSGSNIRYYAIFAPSSKVWDKVAKQNQLINDEGVSDLQPGIYVSTRGMPTGIGIDPPEAGSSGYWPNTYMVLGYDGFKFDLGRKSIASSTQGMLKELAHKKFRKFVNWKNAIRTSNTTPSTKAAQVVRTQRQERFEQMSRIPDINYPGIHFEKKPDDQEAGVVSIFHELVGSGELDNYKAYRTGYNQDYDFWGKYEAAVDELGQDLQSEFQNRDMIEQNVVLEAKYDAADVIWDIEEERKYLADIDMIYCWEVNEEAFNDSSVLIEELDPQEKFYVGSTHKVIPAGTNSLIGPQLYIMSLKDYIRQKR